VRISWTNKGFYIY